MKRKSVYGKWERRSAQIQSFELPIQTRTIKSNQIHRINSNCIAYDLAGAISAQENGKLSAAKKESEKSSQKLSHQLCQVGQFDEISKRVEKSPFSMDSHGLLDLWHIREKKIRASPYMTRFS